MVYLIFYVKSGNLVNAVFESRKAAQWYIENCLTGYGFTKDDFEISQYSIWTLQNVIEQYPKQD